jgi:general secretion pathway protein N
MLKKRFQWALLAIVVYLVFLIVYLPAKQATSRLTLPNNTKVYGVSGSIWQGQAQRATVKGVELRTLEWSLNFLPLLTGRISADIEFGNIRETEQVSAKGQISIKGKAFDASDLILYVPVAQLISQFTLPFPADVGGRLKVELDDISYDQYCTALSGDAQWLNASVNTFNTAVELGTMSAKLNCETQQVTLDIQQPNVLGLAAKAKVDAKGKFSINGKFKPDDSLPPQIKRAASIFGEPDSSGFYTLEL